MERKVESVMDEWKEDAEDGVSFVRRYRKTHNMKSCSQQGKLPLTAMVVLFTFCTFRVT